MDPKGLLLVLTITIVIYLSLPLGSALEFGGDEGFELMKGYLCAKGYSLYSQIWNDQPPVLTMLLSLLFKSCGPSVLAARCLACGFGLLLFGTFFTLLQSLSGRFPALVQFLPAGISTGLIVECLGHARSPGLRHCDACGVLPPSLERTGRGILAHSLGGSYGDSRKH